MYVKAMNVLHQKIVSDSSEKSAELIIKQTELSFPILFVYGKYTIKGQGRRQKQIMTNYVQEMRCDWGNVHSLMLFPSSETQGHLVGAGRGKV